LFGIADNSGDVKLARWFQNTQGKPGNPQPQTAFHFVEGKPFFITVTEVIAAAP
jgi:hypothetical protein